MALILYTLFFVSGFAALIYEVAWARSLSLVFGGSHLAVTIVLSVYMGGLAQGSRLFGRRASTTRPTPCSCGARPVWIRSYACVRDSRSRSPLRAV